MKKVILLFTSISALLYVALTSYSNGASATSKAHNAAVSGCGGAGCHGGASSTATTATITVKEKSSGMVVSNGKYKPGTTYEITVQGDNASAAKFGYMFLVRDAVNAQGGTLANASAGSKIQTIPPGTYTVAEHSSPINASMGSFTATFEWTAPAAGKGNINMNLAVNAVDGTGTTANDEFNTASVVLTEDNTASISTLANSINVSTYPNPVKDVLNIAFSNAKSAQYHIQVVNMNGQVVVDQTSTVAATSTITINTSNWTPGVYQLLLNNGQARESIQIVK